MTRKATKKRVGGPPRPVEPGLARRKLGQAHILLREARRAGPAPQPDVDTVVALF